jgi:hypothetical protein
METVYVTEWFGYFRVDVFVSVVVVMAYLSWIGVFSALRSAGTAFHLLFGGGRYLRVYLCVGGDGCWWGVGGTWGGR